jgi:hypothetical protein
VDILKQLFMTRFIVVPSALLIVTVMTTIVTAADVCTIDNLPRQFFMIAGASGASSQDTYQLYYSTASAPATVDATQGPSITATCQDEAKGMSILNKTGFYVAYSNSVGGSGFPRFKMNSGCVKDETYFNVRLTDKFQYEITDQDGNCQALVADTPQGIIHMSNCTNMTQLYAVAVLTWEETPVSTPTGNYPFAASWNVTIVDPSVLNLYVLTMLSVKLNDAMECTPTSAPGPAPTAPESPALSSAAVIVIAVLVSGFLAVGVFLGLRFYFKRIDYAQLRQTINESHEA